MTNKNPRQYRFLKYLIANYGSCLNDHVPWSKRNTITKLISFIGISLFQFVALMKCVCICIVITVCQFVGFPNNRYGSGSFVSQATIGGTVTNAFIDLTNFTSITLLSYLRYVSNLTETRSLPWRASVEMELKLSNIRGYIYVANSNRTC